MDVAIGQGFVTATPLQIAVAYMGLANRGEIYRPYLVKRVMTPGGAGGVGCHPAVGSKGED